MFIRIKNCPEYGMERLIECDDFIFDIPKERLTTGMKYASGFPVLNLIRGTETECFAVTNDKMVCDIISSETGKTIRTYKFASSNDKDVHIYRVMGN